MQEGVLNDSMNSKIANSVQWGQQHKPAKALQCTYDGCNCAYLVQDIILTSQYGWMKCVNKHMIQQMSKRVCL